MTDKKIGELKHHCENHQKCMQMIQAVLDGSATPEELKHFEEEADHCLPCIEGIEQQKLFKSLIQNKVDQRTCPESLRAKIMESTQML